MCFRRSRYRDESAEQAHDVRLWDLFHRETEASPPPVEVGERELSAAEEERDEVPAGTER
jgi:hypothetical protein